MKRRTKALIWAVSTVAVLLAGAAGLVWVVAQTQWGHELLRNQLATRITKSFAGRGTLTIGRLDGSIGGRIVMDSVTLLDDRGRLFATISRIELNADVISLLSKNMSLSRLLLVRPHVILEQSRDSTWNYRRIFPPSDTPRLAPAPLAIALDSAQVVDGRLEVISLDSLLSMPMVYRNFSALNLRAGKTTMVRGGITGTHGDAELRELSLNSNRPPIDLVHANGAVQWWKDSLVLALPEVRLPGTHANLNGSIGWRERGFPRLNLLMHADTLALADVAWSTTLIPKRGGTGSADLHIVSGPSTRNIAYEITKADVRSGTSRFGGGFTVVTGPNPSVTDLALSFAPLDLDLVREIFGDSLPNKAWQGTLTGTVRGRGGPTRALRLENVQMLYADKRVPGALSHFTMNGVLDVAAKPLEFHEVALGITDLDIRTLGVISKTADSLHGILTGRLVLDGPSTNVRFHDLLLWHQDGALPRSRFAGSGRIATNHNTNWLEAALTLDTVQVATLMRDRTTLPLRGILSGTLGLSAFRDTMTIAALVRADSGSVKFNGYSLLDSLRTIVRGSATLRAFDPRVLIDRGEIPFLRLSGSGTLDVDSDRRRTDGHLNLSLDSTSIVGTSRVTMGQLRAGMDDNGLHVDTAEVHTSAWKLSARGKLARTGITADTLRFRAEIDSLHVLRSLWLDSAGAPKVDSLKGRAVAEGMFIGSLEHMRDTASFGLTDAAWKGGSVRLAMGTLDLRAMPDSANGPLHFTALDVTNGTLTARKVQATATISNGNAARVVGLVEMADSAIAAHLSADATRSGDTTRVAVDSLTVKVGDANWILQRGTRVVISPRNMVIDSTVLLRVASDSALRRGEPAQATAIFAASLPEDGPVSGMAHLRSLGLGALAFTGKLSSQLTGVIHADATLAGTRDAPTLVYSAALDSVTMAEKPVPSLAVTGSYASKQLKADVRGIDKSRELFSAVGTVPMDLTLRSVDKRLLKDAPLSVLIRADSAPLAGLEAFSPDVSELAGSVTANVSVGGTWTKPVTAGTLNIRDGAFYLPASGTTGRALAAVLSFSGDSVRIERLRLSDGDNPKDSATVAGIIYQKGTDWLVSLKSRGTNFKVMDQPRLAIIDAQWNLDVEGPLRTPFISGDVTLPSATIVIGDKRRVRKVYVEGEDEFSYKPTPIIKTLQVVLGDDVRLKSADANVQLTGSVEVAGDLTNPYISGEVLATRGTYRVDLGVIKRSFRVDSGIVRIAGTKDNPASLDIWTSYLVRRVDLEDIKISAHLAGTTDAPRLELLSNDAGATLAQGEIISYLIFGAPSFAVGGQYGQTAYAAILPTIGGFFEGALGSVFPFFSSLQVTTRQSNVPQNLATGLDALINSLAITGERRIGASGFGTVSFGVCRGTRAAAAQSTGGWFGITAEYRPKGEYSVVASLDPGPSPCTAVGRISDIYQLGFDVFKEWKR